MLKFPTSYNGALVWNSDLHKYHEQIAKFRLELVTEKFEVLKELGSLLIVKPENIKIIISEGKLLYMPPATISKYLALRSDWTKLQKYEKDLFA
jgi:hypothetical protein